MSFSWIVLPQIGYHIFVEKFRKFILKLNCYYFWCGLCDIIDALSNLISLYVSYFA